MNLKWSALPLLPFVFLMNTASATPVFKGTDPARCALNSVVKPLQKLGMKQDMYLRVSRLNSLSGVDQQPIRPQTLANAARLDEGVLSIEVEGWVKNANSKQIPVEGILQISFQKQFDVYGEFNGVNCTVQQVNLLNLNTEVSILDETILEKIGFLN